MEQDLESYKTFAIDFARTAGKTLREKFFAIEKEGVAHKADDTPVTETDKQINEALIEAVKQAFPEHSVLGEEESNMKPGDKQVWVCDPIDGTEAFIYGLPTAMVALAYVYDGEPLVGVVYDPFLDRMFSAIKGNGAYLNGNKISVNPHPQTKYVASPSSFDELLRTQDFYGSLRDHGYRLAICYGGMYKSTLLAEGRLSARVFLHDTTHDVAAVKVIVEEAGGKVTDIKGQEQRYDRPINGAILSNGSCHDELVRLVASHGVALNT